MVDFNNAGTANAPPYNHAMQDFSRTMTNNHVVTTMTGGGGPTHNAQALPLEGHNQNGNDGDIPNNAVLMNQQQHQQQQLQLQQPPSDTNHAQHQHHPINNQHMSNWMQQAGPQAAAQMFAAYTRMQQGGGVMNGNNNNNNNGYGGVPLDGSAPAGQTVTGAATAAAGSATAAAGGQPETALLQVAAVSGGNAGGGNNSNSRPTFVNAKQYHRIIKRREARAKLTEYYRIRRAACEAAKKPYMHESRHRHAMKRPRGKGGRFLTKPELEVYYKQHPDQVNPDDPHQEQPNESKKQKMTTDENDHR